MQTNDGRPRETYRTPEEATRTAEVAPSRRFRGLVVAVLVLAAIIVVLAIFA
jgi:hypothetical protein